MKRQVKHLPRPGTLIGVIALVVALGGTAIALPGKNRVDKNDFKKGAVNARAIGKNAVGLPELSAGAEAGIGTRWALVNESGQIERQSGGFSIVNCYQANANCYLNAGEDVTNNGLDAEISVANTDGSNILSGETGTAACGAATVACAPPGTETNSVVVVAPRDSTGAVPGGVTPPLPANAARFYVFVTNTQG